MAILSGKTIGGIPSAAMFLAAIALLLDTSSAFGASTTSSPSVWPYTSTKVVTPPPFALSNDIGYVFQSRGDGTYQFLQVNYTNEVDVQLLSTGLSFLDGVNPTTAFEPVMTEDGTLAVYAGDCQGDTPSAIWHYDPLAQSWNKKRIDHGDSGRTFFGPGFQGATIAFSNVVGPGVVGGSVLYSFGGMCPYTNDSTSDDWMLNAAYSNRMSRLVPESSSQQNSLLETDPDETRRRTAGDAAVVDPVRDYVLSPVDTNNPGGVLCAGFTFTPLLPSTTSVADTVTQSRRYVIIGGESQVTFHDIMELRVWTFPDETVQYVRPRDDELPTTVVPTTVVQFGTPTVTMTVASMTSKVEIQGRAGHTAVLSEDGTKLVVMGGWIGNTRTMATPQLVVLDIRPSFADWAWEWVEHQPGTSGVFGHGAAVLPGNVMMIYGGWSTDRAADSVKRAVETPSFLNLTSMEWSGSYMNPGYISTPPIAGDIPPEPSLVHPGESEASDSNSNKDLKLGLGLGFGIVGGLILIFLCVWLYVRCRRGPAHNMPTLPLTHLRPQSENRRSSHRDARNVNDRLSEQAMLSDSSTDTETAASTTASTIASAAASARVSREIGIRALILASVASLDPIPVGGAYPPAEHLYAITELDEESTRSMGDLSQPASVASTAGPSAPASPSTIRAAAPPSLSPSSTRTVRRKRSHLSLRDPSGGSSSISYVQVPDEPFSPATPRGPSSPPVTPSDDSDDGVSFGTARTYPTDNDDGDDNSTVIHTTQPGSPVLSLVSGSGASSIGHESFQVVTAEALSMERVRAVAWRATGAESE